MNFISPVFGLFLIIGVSIYSIIPSRFKNMLLLFISMSYLFLLDLKTLLVILPYICINYLAHVYLSSNANHTRKKLILYSAILGNILFLAIFKYLRFLLGIILGSNSPISTQIPIDAIALVGVSFFAFKTIHFIVDTYRGSIRKTRLSQYTSYILLFPQFLSGPIQRFQNFNIQLVSRDSLTEPELNENIRFGFYRIFQGIFKKTVIADRLAPFVNPIFLHPTEFSGLPLVMAAYLYTMQIYFDFSGYTDIAIGICRLFGITAPENFNKPYALRSIREFWRRWHITLSEWFRDYIYIPLGGNRVEKYRSYLNILVVFTITGLWHGANWTFIVWGLIHGLYQLLALLLPIPGFRSAPDQLKENSLKLWQISSTLIAFHLIVASWILFRANSLTDALYIYTHLFSKNINLPALSVPVTVAATLAMLIVLSENIANLNYYMNKKWAKVFVIIFGSLLILLFGQYGGTDFLYFRF